MIQNVVHLDNNIIITLTKDRYKSLSTEFSQHNYEVEFGRNGQAFCLYMDKYVLQNMIDSLTQFLTENEED